MSVISVFAITSILSGTPTTWYVMSIPRNGLTSLENAQRRVLDKATAGSTIGDCGLVAQLDYNYSFSLLGYPTSIDSDYVKGIFGKVVILQLTLSDGNTQQVKTVASRNLFFDTNVSGGVTFTPAVWNGSVPYGISNGLYNTDTAVYLVKYGSLGSDLVNPFSHYMSTPPTVTFMSLNGYNLDYVPISTDDVVDTANWQVALKDASVVAVERITADLPALTVIGSRVLAEIDLDATVNE